ncbi:MAG: trigger factor [Muribaculaceae bacterium]|nr:trigger factor [Muribaculaceae bacterium]
MNVNFEKIDPVNATLTISFVEEDYKSDVKKNLSEIGMRRPLKGFRPGHVPAALLEKMFGTQVLSDVIDRKVSRALTDYIIQNHVRILGEPMLDKDTKVDLTKEKEFSFKFDMGLEPEFDLTVDKSVSVPYYTIQVTDEMVDKQNATFRRRYGKQVPGEVAAEDSMIRGSLVELNEDGTEKENGIKAERTIIAPKYLSDDEQKAKFVGAKVNDTIVYNPSVAVAGNINELAAMLNVDKENADVKSDFALTVNEILVNEDAELNQEFFDNALGKGQATNEEEYLAKVKDLLAAQLKNDSNYRFTLDVEEKLRQLAGDLPLPEEFLKRFLLQRTEGQDASKVEEQFPETKKQLQWQIIKEKVAQQLNVKVEVEDKLRLARYFAAQQFAQYGMSNLPDDVLDNYAHKLLEDERSSNDIETRALEDKLFAAIKDAVTLDEKSVSVDEFNKLFEK